jgi:hypothetical protein
VPDEPFVASLLRISSDREWMLAADPKSGRLVVWHLPDSRVVLSEVLP